MKKGYFLKTYKFARQDPKKEENIGNLGPSDSSMPHVQRYLDIAMKKVVIKKPASKRKPETRKGTLLKN
jgi:hypothetical protein